MLILLKTIGKLLTTALTLLCKLMHSKIYHSKLHSKMEQKAVEVLEKIIWLWFYHHMSKNLRFCSLFP